MNYVVISYPNISKADYHLIQKIRKEHDNQYDIVDPHFTIVFPTTELTELSLIQHTELQIQDTSKIDFILNKAIVKKNSFTGRFQVHLVSTDAIQGVVEIHDKLYTGKLSSELRTDIPYNPHITIADSSNEAEIDQIAKRLNSEKLSIRGTIEKITVGSFDGSKVATVKEFLLED